ncbi:MAG: PKD domain-containing protein [Candidatus Promineifilaceae bacterium]
MNTTLGSPELVTVTFSDNSADKEGGGICIDRGSPTLKNSILWGNTANTLIDREKQVYSKVSFVMEDSLVQHGCNSTWGCGSNIITIDPQFVDAANDDLRLRGTSPAVDSGNDVHLPADTLDLDGDLDTSEQLPLDRAGGARIYGNSVDMGAYETQCYGYEMDKGDDLLDQGRDYRVDFHNEDSTTPKTIKDTKTAYNEAVITRFQQSDEHYAIALVCAVSEDQKRDAIEGRFNARWEIATGSMLQGNDQMVQALDVETDDPDALGNEIDFLVDALSWYSPATDLYKELLTDGRYTDYIDKNGERTDPISGQTMSDMERLAQASAKKSRAYLELAERQFRKYAKDEAEETLRRGIALAIVEQALLASLWPESDILQEDVSYQALGRNISGMQRLFDYLVENKNPLGYGPEYVAFHYQPKNDEPGGKRQNNYEQTAVLASAKQESAREAVDDAEDYKGRVDDDFEKLQKDLENIRDKYDKQQVEICGTNDDLEPDLDGCFTNPGGRMYEQMERINEAHYRLQLVQVQMENQQYLIDIEQDRLQEVTKVYDATWYAVDQLTQKALDFDADSQDESLQTAGKVLQGVNSIVSGALSGGGGWGSVIGGVSSALGFIGGEMGGPSEEVQLLKDLKELQAAEIQFKGLEINKEHEIEIANSAAVVKRLALRFAELNVERAIAMSNLQQELARLEGLITQLQYTQAERHKAKNFLELWQDPAVRVMRDYWMELANDRFDVAMDYAYRTGRALDYEVNQDITYSGLPLTHLQDLYQIHDPASLKKALDQMDDAYNNWLGSAEIPSPQKARDRVYLSQAVGFEDSYDPALDRIVTREEKFNAFLRDPANWIDLDNDGTPESVRFTFQTSIFLGNQFFATSVFNDKISSIEMRVRGSTLGDEQVVLHLTQSGTSFMRTQNAFKNEGSDDIRTYNIAAQKARITAATNENMLPAEIAANRELATRSVAFTTWTLTIDNVHEPNNFDLDIESIEEIELTIIHEAYTLQGISSMNAAQVEGAPSIFEPPPNRTYRPIAAPSASLPSSQFSLGMEEESLIRQSASDLTGTYMGAVLVNDPLNMPPLDLGLVLVDTNGTLSGHIESTRAVDQPVLAVADGKKLGPSLSGSRSGDSFTLQSEEYTNDFTPGITRQIVLDSGVISENGNILSGVYSETLTGLAPEPVVITGDFQLYRSAKDLSAMADFKAVPRSGSAPLTVQFSDQSGGAPNAWNWDFGDGSTSTEQNPSHTYTANGRYTVTLQVDYETDEPSTVTKTDYIIVAEPTEPRATFSASPLFGIAPLTVAFTDESGGVPSSWSWDFGDGGTSTEQHPTHTYSQEGIYDVTLTISNAIGSDTKFAPNYVTVTDTISIYLPLTLNNVD